MISPMVTATANASTRQSDAIIELGKTDFKIIKTALILLGAISSAVMAIGVGSVPLFGKTIVISQGTVQCAGFTLAGSIFMNRVMGTWNNFFEETLGKVHNALF
ncbi:hypothetical protein PHSC3_000697 [Chlamydiales bacterium STE3]|nr:hypothetical protein PHSC3_000697 [Chlamydiales bacterium STE3]